MKKIYVPTKIVEDYAPKDFGGIREEKTACVVRYGGFGDMIQASSLFPVLKEMGYRVCVNVTETGHALLSNNPHVDELIIQGDNQISNFSLGEYWEKMSPCFEKFVQLSESIEGTLLLNPKRTIEIDGKPHMVEGNESYDWSKEEIHKLCNKNYLEETHRIAGIEFKHAPFYFPSSLEKRWAKKTRKKIKTKNVVMVVLSGSSVHKVYPWIDNVIATLLLKRKDVSIITMGDAICQLLEAGWENEPRVITKSGKWSITKTLSFLPHCDVIVGPETGLLNAASAMKNHKCVFLSHSSKENLTKHWRNTTSMEPDDCPCFPCHKLHFGFSTCNRDKETGASLCAANIDHLKVAQDILRNLK